MSLLNLNKSQSTQEDDSLESQVIDSQKKTMEAMQKSMPSVDPRKYVLEVAEKSPCVKRRVGAVIVDKNDRILSEGYNWNTEGSTCEDENGETRSQVVHAEIVCLEDFERRYKVSDWNMSAFKMYVTHEPCISCLGELTAVRLPYEVIKDCIKFDTGKLRYDLVPTEAYKGIAEVMTFGARKYKPNNWRTVDDVHRFMGAAERHYQEFKYVMETGDCSKLYDEETGLHVLKHVMTNLTFIMELVSDKEAVEAWREKLS